MKTTNKITVTYEHHGGTDLATVNSARVSFNKRSEVLSDKDQKLVKYLSEHKHTSPFNHAYATFVVKAPIVVARHLVKHEYLPWNEVSRRYVDDEPEFYVPDDLRGRSADKKQGSEGVVYIDRDLIAFANHTSLRTYNEMLEAGVCPEQARGYLPQFTMTEWWWSGTIGAWAKMCNERCHPNTQLETRIVADQISEKMTQLFPVSWSALRGY
jgi:thymidylate synthase (FAD)